MPAFVGSREPMSTARLCLPNAGNESPMAASLIKSHCLVCMVGAQPSSGKSECRWDLRVQQQVCYLQWQLMERGSGRHYGEQIGRREEIELQPRLAASLGRAGEREDASRTAGPDFCQGR